MRAASSNSIDAERAYSSSSCSKPPMATARVAEEMPRNAACSGRSEVWRPSSQHHNRKPQPAILNQLQVRSDHTVMPRSMSGAGGTSRVRAVSTPSRQSLGRREDQGKG